MSCQVLVAVVCSTAPKLACASSYGTLKVVFAAELLYYALWAVNNQLLAKQLVAPPRTVGVTGLCSESADVAKEARSARCLFT
jgi:hypothetical protein